MMRADATAIEEGICVESSKLRVASVNPKPEGRSRMSKPLTPAIAQAARHAGNWLSVIG